MGDNLAKWQSSATKHVLMVSRHCCTRVRKQALALRALGWRVDSLSQVPPTDRNAFDMSVIADRHKFHRFIERSGAAIIHVHNEPDSLMRDADAGARGRPVVYDCHDLEFYRYGSVTSDEAYAFDRADSIVHVSDEHRDVAYSLHPWKVPEAVVMSCPIKAWIPPDPNTDRDGVVYEGGLTKPGSAAFDWRDLTDACAVFAAAGITFDLYSHESLAPYYERLQPWLDYDNLLRRLHRYKFGFLGTDKPVEKWKVAVPNKMWEYAACGVVPMAVNAPAAVKAFGQGAIVATSTAEAIEQMGDCSRLRALMRPRFMDDEIAGTIRLYEGLL